MVSTGISGVAPVSNVTPSVSTSARNENVSFGEFMMQSMTGQGGMETENSYSKVNTQTKVNEIPQASNAAERKVSSKANDKGKLEKQSKEVDTTKVETKVEDAVEDIKDKIKETFDVTDEDIEKALEKLGLTMSDLLNQVNLTDFVVELTGVESSIDLLVSSEMSKNFNELLTFVSQTVDALMEEFDITMEELVSIIDEVELVQNVQDDNVSDVLLDNANLVEETFKQDVSDDNINDSLNNAVDDGVGEQVTKSITLNNTNTESKLETASDRKQMDMADDGLKDNIPNDVVNNFTNAINEAFVANGIAERIDSVQVVNQIVENAKLMLNREVTSVEFVLNPENLGKINLNISVRDGIVTASIVAQNEAVKEAIESQIVALKENLNNQGLKVEAVEVTVESHALETGTNQSQNEGFNEQKEEAKKNGNRPLRLDSLEELMAEELTDEEKIILDMMEDEGNQINFKA